jgi:hypothetical protein
MSWDNLTDAQLAEMPRPNLEMRVAIYAIVAADRKARPDYPEVSQALDRAIAAMKAHS